MELSTKARKTTITIIVALLTMLTIGTAIYKISMKDKFYARDFITAYGNIVYNAAVCQSQLMFISSVWQQSENNGSSFNMYYVNMLKDNSVINSHKKTLVKDMAKLKSPPALFKKEFLKLTDLFEIYMKMESLALSPTLPPEGTLAAFNEQASSIQKDYSKTKKELSEMAPKSQMRQYWKSEK